MKLTNKAVGWVTADWAESNPKYKLNISYSPNDSWVLDFYSTAPYTVEGYDIALKGWHESKHISWGIAVLTIIKTTPIVVAISAAREVGASINLTSEYTFDDAVNTLPEELIAEFLLEGIIQ